MSFTSSISGNALAKKCGEITITMKKNTKNVFSFNCWFCDTICLQMKKFTLHLEQEHVTQLEQTIPFSYEQNKYDFDDNTVIEKATETDILDREMKFEDCTREAIKYEIVARNSNISQRSQEEGELSAKFRDPFENFKENTDEKSPPFPIENNEIHLNGDPEQQLDNDIEDVEIHNSSDEYQEDKTVFSSEDSSSDYEVNGEDGVGKKCLNPMAQKVKAKEKKFILTLIEEYHKRPQLWDTTLATRYSLKQKEDLLQKITDGLNEKLKINLKLYVVKKKLNLICKQYEQEIERQLSEKDQAEEIYVTELWFYENMSFLKTIIEQKLKMKKKKPNHKVKPLSENILCDLIDIYKNYNSLWDVNHLAYTVKDKRHEIMQSMLNEIKNKMNISLDVYRLEKHLNYIHKSFTKDKKYRLDCEAKQQEFQPVCSFFSKCDFLEAHQGPFKCPNCGDTIETYNDYQIHKSQHDGSMPFKCHECGMGFKKITNYTIHAKRHLRVFKFHCEICGKGYPFNAELDLHMRSHTGAQPYLCSICGEGFRTAISYDNHIRRHEERFKYFCHICKKGFNHMTRLNDHVKAHLNVRDVICTVCGKGFTSRKYLNHHKRIHEGKNYSCNICGKSFAQDAGLRAHKKYHGTPIGVSSIHKTQKNK